MRAALRCRRADRLAGLGGLWAERAGVVNIGLEGMMILGTWGAGWARLPVGPVGRRRSSASPVGALGGLLHALATVTFGVDHIVSGVAINILAAGVDRVTCPALAFADVQGGGPTQSPPIDDIAARHDPGLSGLRSPTSSSKHWFLVSDLAGIVCGAADTELSLLTIVAVAVGRRLTYVLLWRTAVRPAAALVRREPGRGRVARRQRLPATSTSRSSSPAASPGSAARSWPMVVVQPSTARARPAAAATSASPR